VVSAGGGEDQVVVGAAAGELGLGATYGDDCAGGAEDAGCTVTVDLICEVTLCLWWWPCFAGPAPAGGVSPGASQIVVVTSIVVTSHIVLVSHTTSRLFCCCNGTAAAMESSAPAAMMFLVNMIVV